MEAPGYTTYESVLEVVRTWPPDKRFLLIQDVMKTLEMAFHTERKKRQTAGEALGLLTTGSPAPSDTEIQQWLEEHRMEKYG
jgi:hypothetical protein